VKASEMRELNVEELLSQKKQLQEALFNLKFQQSIGQLENVSRIKATQKDIARIFTVLRERGSAQ
jgi:large subunit ribosomal protein L29